MRKIALDNLKQKHAARKAVAGNIAGANQNDITNHFLAAVNDADVLFKEYDDMSLRLQREQLEHLQTNKKLIERQKLHQDAVHEVDRLREKLKYARKLLKLVGPDDWSDEEKQIISEIMED